MSGAWWDDLGDDELYVRLVQRLGGPGNEARARWITDNRDLEDAAAGHHRDPRRRLMPWGQIDETPVERRFPGVRAECIERGDLIPRDRIDAVLAVLEIKSPDTVAALVIDGIANDEGQWRGQVTIIRRATTRRRIDGKGLNGPARFVEHHTEHRSTAQIIATEEP